MPARTRRLVVLGLVLYLGYGLGLTLLQDRMIFPAPAGRPAHAAATADGLGALEVEVVTEDGLRLRGLHVPSGGDGLVLYAHGNAETAWSRPDLYRWLQDHGWDVLAVEYRGYGGNPGVPSEEGIERDLRAFWRHATEDLGFPGSRVVLHGFSLGGGAVGTLLDEVRPGGLILEATFASVADLARSRAPFYPLDLLLRHPFRTIDRLGGLDAPALVVHGTADRVVPVAHGRGLAGALPDGVYVEVDGAGHHGLIGWSTGASAACASLLDRVRER